VFWSRRRAINVVLFSTAITVAILAQGTNLALALQQAFSATLAQAVVLQQVDYRDISMLRHV